MTPEEELEKELAGESNEAPIPTDEGNENVPQEAESPQDNREEGASGTQPNSPENEPVDSAGAEDTAGEVDAGETEEGVSDAKEPVGDEGVQVGGQMMTMETLKHLNKTKTWVEKLNGRLADGIQMNHLGMMTIDDGVKVLDLDDTLTFLSESEINARNIDIVLKRGIGKTINQIAAIEEKDIAQVISERNVCEGTGRSIDTVYDYCRVARELPEECFMFGLSWTHYVSAARIAAPKDVDQRIEFCKRRVEVLKEAAENKGTSSKDVKNRLIDTSRALTMKNNDKDGEVQPEATASLWRNLIDLYSLYVELDAHPDLLNGTGLTRADIMDGMEYRKNELINRRQITDSVENVVKSLKLIMGSSDAPIDVDSEDVSEDAPVDVTTAKALEEKAKSEAFKKSKEKVAAAKKKGAKK